LHDVGVFISNMTTDAFLATFWGLGGFCAK